MKWRNIVKTSDGFCFVLAAGLYILSLHPISRLLDRLVYVNSLGLCVGGLGFASLGMILREKRINDRTLLYIVIIWLFGLIVWASIG